MILVIGKGFKEMWGYKVSVVVYGCKLSSVGILFVLAVLICNNASVA